MKWIKLFEDYKNDWIVCYHRSNNLEHLKNAEFSLDYANNENSVFGKAIYFASSSDISYQLGKYLCKYEIKLYNPLNLNDEISNDKANELLTSFLNKYNVKIRYYNKDVLDMVEYYDFNEEYNNVQYGEFFLQLSDIIYIHDNVQIYYHDFIKNVLGYNSFYHYSDYGTNFLTEKGDYGYCYGLLYDNEDMIKFIDGPY
jgi:hypothetical protein